MGVLQEQSCGDILYQYIDDMAPVHSGETGTVAISKLSGRIYSCVNKYDWTTYQNTNVLGSMYVYENGAETNDNALVTWTNLDSLTWTIKDGNGFSLVTSNHLTPDEDVLGYFLTKSTHTYMNKSTRGSDYEAGAARTNFVPPVTFGGSVGTIGSGSDHCSFSNYNIYQLDGRGVDFINCAEQRVGEEAAQARVARKHILVEAKTFIEPIRLDESWNSGSIDTNGWTLINDTTNKWVVSTATTRTGTYSLYVSNDVGITNSYDNTTANVSHIYIDIAIPNNLDLTNSINLHFYWAGVGENTLDYSKIYVTPTSVTPVAGTEVDSTYQVGTNELSGQASFIAETISIGGGYSWNGETARIIISWVNNGSAGSQPTAIDDIRLSFYTNHWLDFGTQTFFEDFESGSFTANTWTVANDPTDNTWYVDTAENNTPLIGNNGAYISTSASAGATATYSSAVGGEAISHFYKDFVIPTGITEYRMIFDWKCGGSNIDIGAVIIESTATTVTGGVRQTTSLATAGGNGRIGGDELTGSYSPYYITDADINWQTQVIDLSVYIGETKRIIFEWFNSAAADTPPGFIIDNIRILEK